MKDYYRKKAHTDQYIITFDDILILPGYTRFNPKEVELSTILGKKYRFNLPFMSSAMDTVTESEMAIKMALFGGLGVIHRNCSYQKQLQMVHNVKRARSFVISDVATINQDDTIEKAKFMMEKGNISG